MVNTTVDWVIAWCIQIPGIIVSTICLCWLIRCGELRRAIVFSAVLICSMVYLGFAVVVEPIVDQCTELACLMGPASIHTLAWWWLSLIDDYVETQCGSISGELGCGPSISWNGQIHRRLILVFGTLCICVSTISINIGPKENIDYGLVLMGLPFFVALFISTLRWCTYTNIPHRAKRICVVSGCFIIAMFTADTLLHTASIFVSPSPEVDVSFRSLNGMIHRILLHAFILVCALTVWYGPYMYNKQEVANIEQQTLTEFRIGRDETSLPSHNAIGYHSTKRVLKPNAYCTDTTRAALQILPKWMFEPLFSVHDDRMRWYSELCLAELHVFFMYTQLTTSVIVEHDDVSSDVSTPFAMLHPPKRLDLLLSKYDKLVEDNSSTASASEISFETSMSAAVEKSVKSNSLDAIIATLAEAKCIEATLGELEHEVTLFLKYWFGNIHATWPQRRRDVLVVLKHNDCEYGSITAKEPVRLPDSTQNLSRRSMHLYFYGEATKQTLMGTQNAIEAVRQVETLLSPYFPDLEATSIYNESVLQQSFWVTRTRRTNSWSHLPEIPTQLESFWHAQTLEDVFATLETMFPRLSPTDPTTLSIFRTRMSRFARFRTPQREPSIGLEPFGVKLHKLFLEFHVYTAVYVHVRHRYRPLYSLVERLLRTGDDSSVRAACCLLLGFFHVWKLCQGPDTVVIGNCMVAVRAIAASCNALEIASAMTSPDGLAIELQEFHRQSVESKNSSFNVLIQLRKWLGSSGSDSETIDYAMGLVSVVYTACSVGLVYFPDWTTEDEKKFDEDHVVWKRVGQWRAWSEHAIPSVIDVIERPVNNLLCMYPIGFILSMLPPETYKSKEKYWNHGLGRAWMDVKSRIHDGGIAKQRAWTTVTVVVAYLIELDRGIPIPDTLNFLWRGSDIDFFLKYVLDFDVVECEQQKLPVRRPITFIENPWERPDTL